MGWHSDGIGKIYYVEKNYRFGEVVAIGAHPSSAASGMVNTSSKIGYASEEYEEMWCFIPKLSVECDGEKDVKDVWRALRIVMNKTKYNKSATWTTPKKPQHQ